jgi:hypothetical protein
MERSVFKNRKGGARAVSVERGLPKKADDRTAGTRPKA